MGDPDGDADVLPNADFRLRPSTVMSADSGPESVSEGGAPFDCAASRGAPSTNSSHRRPLEGSDSISAPVIVAVPVVVAALPGSEANPVALACEASFAELPPLSGAESVCALADVWATTEIGVPTIKVNTAAAASGFNQPHLKLAIRYLP